MAFKTGWACYEAAQDVKRQMLERAALLWETSVDEVVLVEGVFRHKSDSDLNLPFSELALRQLATGGPVVGRANVNSAGPGATFATAIVDVEVDP